MEGYAVLQADGAGRAVLQNRPSSMSVWQTLAAGLAPWLTLKSWVLQGKKMASLWFKQPALFYGERTLKVSLKALPPQSCKINHLRKKHSTDWVTSAAIWCINPTAAHKEGGRRHPSPVRTWEWSHRSRLPISSGAKARTCPHFHTGVRGSPVPQQRDLHAF